MNPSSDFSSAHQSLHPGEYQLTGSALPSDTSIPNTEISTKDIIEGRYPMAKKTEKFKAQNIKIRPAWEPGKGYIQE